MGRCGPASRIKSLVPCTTRSPFLTRCSDGKPLRRLLLRSKAEVIVRHDTLLASSLFRDAPIVYAASARRARGLRRAPVTKPDDRTSKVTVARTGVDVPMLVLRGEWLKAIGFPIGAKAFLSTDKRGDITLTRMGLTRRGACVV